MNSELSKKILDANRLSFATQAGNYDQLEICLSKHAQKNFNRDINYIVTDIMDSWNPGNLPHQKQEQSYPTALDCGAGTGNLSLKFFSNRFNVVAVDISSEMLNKLREKSLRGPQYQKALEIINQDIDFFLARDQRHFDAVVCCSFLHHLPDYLGVLHQMCSRVTSNGYLYIAWEPSPRKLATLFEKRLVQIDLFINAILHDPLSIILWIKKRFQSRKNLRNKNEDSSDDLVDYFVRSGLNLESMVKQITKAGFEIVSLRNFSGRRVGFFRFIAELIGYHDQFSIIARKIT